jgi:HAD superfamily hydrolase (TIGR01509 family)
MDLDGVIIDSEPLHVKTEKRLFSEYGISVEPKDWLRFKGLTPQAVFELVRSKYNLREDIGTFLEKKYRYLAEAYENELSLFPDFLSFVRRFQNGFVFALTTSTRRPLTHWVLTKFRLEDIFQVVVTADDVIHGKPHPEPYTRTIRDLKLKPSECVVIEDSINGVTSAKAAGAKCIAVMTSFQKHELLEADVIVDRLEDIKEKMFQALKRREN